MTEPTTLLGRVDGRPVPRTELDRRLASLRSGPRASALPAPGSPEDRQLTRWVAQVLLTEALCTAEAAARNLAPAGGELPTVRLDQRAAVELGSIAAAAFEGSAAVRAVFAAVTAHITVPAPDRARYLASLTAATPAARHEIWQLSTPDGGFETTPDSLPTTLADALRAAPPGHPVTAAGWTATLLTVHPPAATPADPAADLLASARRIAFVRWLDGARATRLTLVPGLEHPGDPTQPDNHHRH